MGIAWNRTRCCAARDGRQRAKARSVNARGCSRQSMRRHQKRYPRAGIARAGQGSGKCRSRVGLHFGHDRGHRAVVRSMPPATWWQTFILVAIGHRRQRPKPEQQDQKDGEAATHLHFTGISVFAFRLRTNIPLFASARDLFALVSRPMTQAFATPPLPRPKSHDFPDSAAISRTVLRRPPTS